MQRISAVDSVAQGTIRARNGAIQPLWRLLPLPSARADYRCMLHCKTAKAPFAQFPSIFLYHFRHSSDTSEAGSQRQSGGAIEPTKDLLENWCGSFDAYSKPGDTGIPASG
ncbi:MAG: hypothetical protein F9K19_20715 [Rhizobiaceae bacterium]|nr:MAG: hypothetical protein F9K19_20715 [Rhizobiaceae bacterium]